MKPKLPRTRGDTYDWIAYYTHPDGRTILVDTHGLRRECKGESLTGLLAVQPPPPGSGWRIGDAGQWRRDPVRAFRWGREGQHFALGIMLALISALGMYFDAVHIAYGIAASAKILVAFLTYEISEGWRIRDQAYRDIGPAFVGYLVGALLAAIGAILYAHLL